MKKGVEFPIPFPQPREKNSFEDVPCPNPYHLPSHYAIQTTHITYGDEFITTHIFIQCYRHGCFHREDIDWHYQPRSSLN